MRSYLGIRLNLKPPVTQMAFTSKGVNWSRVVVANFLLLGVVSDAHANVVVACSATANCQRGRWDIDEGCMLTTRC